MAQVLIVDDERSIRITLSEFLNNGDYEVSVASDANQALEMLAVENYDVVVTDIIMPRITGVKLLKSIKESAPGVQVIMMTGEPTIETASEAVRTGAFDYLTKPIGKEELVKTVANAVKIKILDDERLRLLDENRQYQDNLEKLVDERTQALRESEEKLKTLLNATTDIAYLAESDGTFLSVNNALVESLGRPREELIGKREFDFLPTEVSEKKKEKLQEILESKKALRWEDGHTGRHFANSVYPIFDDLGAVKQIAAYAKDITKRVQAEQALHKLNAELDERVRDRTEQLTIFVDSVCGREVRMAELKKVITQLRVQLKSANLEPVAYDPLLGPNEEW